jgi:D-alanyl-D-alanine carboxypeptidase (penicillin-binding protein 5/6)
MVIDERGQTPGSDPIGETPAAYNWFFPKARTHMRSFLPLLACLTFAIAAPANAQTPEPPAPLLPAPPAIAAKSWLLLDFQTGQALVSREPDLRIEPASLTKVMTAWLVFDALKQKRITLDQVVPVSEKAWKAEGSRMFIEPRKPVTVDELLKGMIVQSGNDATIALAEAVAGSEEAFADLMNRQAARMGLAGTRFVNATGLPSPQHYSTARDLGVLASALIRDFPEYFPLYSLREYRYNKFTQYNRNLLLGRDPTVDGLKTGFHKSAGYCLIATAKREPRRLVSVVVGTASEQARAQESQKLLNYGFQFYDTVRLYQKGQSVATLPVYKGARDELKAGFAEDFHMSVPRGMADRLKANLSSTQPLLAPVAAGQKVGTLSLTLDGKPAGEYPVVALEAIGIANVFGRAWDTIRLWLK